MDYIELIGPDRSIVGIILGLVVLSGILLAISLIRNASGRIVGAFTALTVLCLFALLAAGTTVSNQELTALKEQKAAYSAEITERYGLSLDAAAISELDFPSERPGSEQAVYGSTTALVSEDELAASIIALAWDGEGFVLLAGPDGSELVELEPIG